MLITVTTPVSKNIMFEAQPTMTIEHVKQIIEYKEDIPRNLQHLYYRGAEIANELTLAQHDIYFNTSFHLKVDIQIYLHNINRNILTYQLSQTEYIESVKRRIEEREGIPADTIRLIHAGRQLEDGRTLEDYFVYHESRVHLVLRLKGC